MGLAVGSGYLDLGIVRFGVLDLPLSFKGSRASLICCLEASAAPEDFCPNGDK